jgi:CubicO group peptidase (beta-lactamase class C family)
MKLPAQFFVALLLSSAALAADPLAAVPAVLQPIVSSNGISGAVALVATNDRILHLPAVGFSSLATRRELRPDDLFWIASMSKPITSVAAALPGR